MTDSDQPSNRQDRPADPAAPPARHGCLTAFMIVCGIILLLPGLCAVIFGIGSFTNSTMEPIVSALFGLGLFVGFLGIMLIWAAIRRLRS